MFATRFVYLTLALCATIRSSAVGSAVPGPGQRGLAGFVHELPVQCSSPTHPAVPCVGNSGGSEGGVKDERMTPRARVTSGSPPTKVAPKVNR